MKHRAEFTIITPSKNMIGYLRVCTASVADQAGVSVEHIVVDAISDDGTPDWLATQRGVVSLIGQDEGMYDGINKGLETATGAYFACLNADEQYLPGTLAAVREYFSGHPTVDIVFGDVLLLRPDGTLIAFRKAYPPRWSYILASHLYVLSCAMFFRRSIIDAGFRFDSSWKDIGDEEFVLRLLRHGFKTGHLRRYTSTFTMTGRNMSMGANARDEYARARSRAPRWVRWLRAPINGLRLAEKAANGAFFERMPLEYEVYTKPAPGSRTPFSATKATYRWSTE